MKLVKIILDKLLCLHDWKVHNTTNIWEKGLDLPVETKETLICKKCGKIKTIWL